MTRELTSLKNIKAKDSKKSKGSKKRKDGAIDNCEWERLREKFVSLREEYQQQHGRANDDTAQDSRRRSRAIRRFFLDM
jgi:hypothetical protein